MENLKSETIKIVTPVGTRFRYSYLVTPDEYLGVEKWKTEALIPVGSQIKNEEGKFVEATVFIVDKLEALLESWKTQLKAAFPNKSFTLTKSSKTGQPSFPWSFEEDNLVIRLKKNYKGQKGINTPVTFYRHDSQSGQNVLMNEDERKTMDKISPETTGQIAFLASGYDAGGNGVGIRCLPLSICFRDIVPWQGGGASDFETTEPLKEEDYEEKSTATSAADF
tara:strand:+ start:68 stop:736 length:669 start_codon:yes stop_codon:yes gene_type:complete